MAAAQELAGVAMLPMEGPQGMPHWYLINILLYNIRVK